jgi:hypothetical protein
VTISFISNVSNQFQSLYWSLVDQLHVVIM